MVPHIQDPIAEEGGGAHLLFFWRFEGALLISSTMKDVKDICAAARIAIID
jgi:hypothetical protein